MQTEAGTSLTEPDKPTGSRRVLMLFSIVAVLVLVTDIATKLWVVATRVDAEPVKLFGGIVYVVHTRNTGAAFSLASGFTVVLTLLAVGVSIFIVVVARRLASPGWAVSLGLILGGALGNLIDRILRDPGPGRGGVVDFISLLDPYDPPWPVFNIADSALVTGVLLAIFLELRGRRIDGTHAGDAKKQQKPSSRREVTPSE